MVVPLLENYRKNRPKWRFFIRQIHYPTDPRGVFTYEGQMVLMVISISAVSSAIALVKPTTPCFAVT